MIPSLLDQLLAAREPTTAEKRKAKRIADRANAVMKAVRKIGNARVTDVMKETGMLEWMCRDTLKTLENRGELISWKQNNSSATSRYWTLAEPEPRRK